MKSNAYTVLVVTENGHLKRSIGRWNGPDLRSPPIQWGMRNMIILLIGLLLPACTVNVAGDGVVLDADVDTTPDEPQDEPKRAEPEPAKLAPEEPVDPPDTLDVGLAGVQGWTGVCDAGPVSSVAAIFTFRSAAGADLGTLIVDGQEGLTLSASEEVWFDDAAPPDLIEGDTVLLTITSTFIENEACAPWEGERTYDAIPATVPHDATSCIAQVGNARHALNSDGNDIPDSPLEPFAATLCE